LKPWIYGQEKLEVWNEKNGEESLRNLGIEFSKK
jgi:hypothetical protein